MMDGQKLKVGLLINSDRVNAWWLEIVRKIEDSDFAEIVVVVQAENPQKFTGDTSSWLFSKFRKFENKTTKLNPNAFAQKSLQKELKNAAIVTIQPVLKEDVFKLRNDDLERLKAFGADLFLQLGFQNVQTGLSAIAKFGVWTFQIGNSPAVPKAMGGVWEVMQNECSLRIALKTVELNDQPKEIVLYESFSTVVREINRSLNMACWKAASFVPRVLKRMRNNVDYFNDLFAGSEQGNTNAQVPSPGNARVLGYMIGRSAAFISRKIRKFSVKEQWSLEIAEISDGITNLKGTDFRRIQPPSDRFWADPCLFTHNGKRYIFLEELIYQKGKAHISVMELQADGKWSDPKAVLKKDYHLSYPFIFEDRGEIYMIPETSGNKTIELYRAKNFPDEWEFQMNLMENLHAVDATVYFKDEKYWLFVNIRENKGASAWDELYLFYADNLLTTDWKPHPLNPVVSDVRTSRPAGRLFVENGKLYRPSQDCSCTYGYATNINEVLMLNENDYREKQVKKLLPDWNDRLKAVHTLSVDDGMAVIDARYIIKK